MSQQPVRSFPLFPLGIVALPSESLPLHIFEFRYRRMIERCLQAAPASPEREFGIVWLAEDELKPVGCACEIERLVERLDDGRLNILVRGTRPFRLLERQDELPYPAGIVEFLHDEPEEADGDAGAAARSLYSELVREASDREIAPAELERLGAYEMAGTVEFEPGDKQQLLELRSENARMRKLALLLQAALERMEMLERAQVRALSNGKVRFA